MRAYLITFRPQVNEQQLLDLFIIYFQDFLSCYAHSWAVEKDGTPGAHFHAYVETQFRDKEKLLKNSEFKKATAILHKLIKSEGYQSTWQPAMDVKIIADTPTDLKKTLGYVNKEAWTRGGQKDITNERIIEAVTYYYAEAKAKAMTFERTDTILVTNKNFTTLMIDFCKKQEIDIGSYTDYEHIKIMMVKAGYDFDLSDKQQSRKMAQLIVRFGSTESHKHYHHCIDILKGDIRVHTQTPLNLSYHPYG